MLLIKLIRLNRITDGAVRGFLADSREFPERVTMSKPNEFAEHNKLSVWIQITEARLEYPLITIQHYSYDRILPSLPITGDFKQKLLVFFEFSSSKIRKRELFTLCLQENLSFDIW